MRDEEIWRLIREHGALYKQGWGGPDWMSRDGIDRRPSWRGPGGHDFGPLDDGGGWRGGRRGDIGIGPGIDIGDIRGNPIGLGEIGAPDPDGPGDTNEPGAPDDGHPGGDGDKQPGEEPENDDPISLSSGDYQLGHTDLAVPGRGLDFAFRRTYRSRSGIHSVSVDKLWKDVRPIGTNWDHSYNIRVFLMAPPVSGVNNVLLGFMPGDGRFELAFYDSTVGANLVPGRRAVFKYDDTARQAIMETADGAVYTFAPFSSTLPYRGGQLESIVDRNGNQITLTYQATDSNGGVRLATVTDTRGEVITFRYHDDVTSPQYNTARNYLLWQVEDSAGRIVEYLYDYVSVTGFNSKEKLVEVRLPAIVAGTDFALPSDHERFPTGRVLNYTYDAEDTSAPWGGQLAEVWSPNGDLVLQNDYSAVDTNRPRNESRVARQVHGTGAYNYKITDTSGVPATISVDPDGLSDDYCVWVNDRKGHITRLDYAGGEGSHPPEMLLRKVEYVGVAANADSPSWATLDSSGDPLVWTNGPGSPLRTGDTSRTTEYVHNEGWKQTAQTYPNGDTIEVLRVRDESLSTVDPRVADQVSLYQTTSADLSLQISERWEYNHTFTSGAPSNFATAHIDPRGYVTLYRYDSNGNRRAIYHDLPPSTSTSISDSAAELLAAAVDEYTHNAWGQVLTHTHPAKATLGPSNTVVQHRRTDSFEYGTVPGPSFGRLVACIVDDGGLELRTEYEYDAIGNTTKIVQPDGNTTTVIYNQAAQPVRLQRWAQDPAVSPSTTLMYQEDLYYDANGNLVRADILNLDGAQQVVTANPLWTTVFGYDLLNRPTEVAVEKHAASLSLTADSVGRFTIPDGADWVNTQFEYDASGNRTAVILPESVDGRQPSNRLDFVFDEFDQLYRSDRGDGLLIVQYDYDDRGRRIREIVSPDNSGTTRTSTAEFDAANRPTKTVDPMGNESWMTWSPTSQLTSVRVVGQLSDFAAGNSGAVLLGYMEHGFDARDRVNETRTGVFTLGSLTPTQTPTAFTISATEFNADSSVFKSIAPLGSYPGVSGSTTEVQLLRDAVGRVVFQSDATGNDRQYEYDSGSNLVEMVSTDVGDGRTEAYHSAMAYDGLDRLTTLRLGSESGGVNNESTVQYDSRSNRLRSEDARGNVTTQVYDGLGHAITSVREMTTTGDGTGSPATDPSIETNAEYDDSGRLTALVDDRGNRTEYAYDGIGRELGVIMPDTTSRTVEWDDAGNAIHAIDARGVEVESFFDLNNRLVCRSIDLSAAVGVGGVLAECYTYDGAGRATSGADDNAQVFRTFDSRSNITSEVQNADGLNGFPIGSDRVVTYAYDIANNLASVAYPGGWENHYTYDEQNRPTGIYEDGSYTNLIASYVFVGPQRIARRTSGNGIEAVRRYTGFDGSSSEPYVLSGDRGFGSLSQIEHFLPGGGGGTVIDQRGFSRDADGNKVRHQDQRSTFAERRQITLGYDSADRLIESASVYPDTLATSVAATTDYALDGTDNRLQVSSTATPDADGTDLSGSLVGHYGFAGANASNNQYTAAPNTVYSYDANGNMVLRAESQGSDFNNNYTVDSDDIFAFLDAWFLQNGLSSPPEPVGSLTADADLNHTVDADDIFVFLDSFYATLGVTRTNDILVYDYRNRLLSVTRSDGVSLVSQTTFMYDVFGRRVLETFESDTSTPPDGTLDATTSIHTVFGGRDGWHALEERDAPTSSGGMLAVHSFGIGIDELVRTDRDLDADTDLDPIYFHQDDLSSIYAATDGVGAVLERYTYGDFGTPHIYAADGVTVRTTSLIGNRQLYTGRQWIGQIDLYDYRHRFLDPRIGRFIQRDPAGYAAGMNLYGYVGHSPYNWVDPLGLWPGQGIWNSVKDIGNTIWEGGGAIITNSDIRNESLTASNLADGLAATADGFIPFCNPIDNNIYDYDECDPTIQHSIALGGVSRDLLLMATGEGVVARLKDLKRAKDAANVAGDVGAVATKAGEGPVIIGETMTRVKEFASNIPGSKILDDMPDFAARGLNADEVTSAMMQHNRKWILEQMRSGRGIIDIGSDPARTTSSIFYQMEKSMLRNYDILHPGAVRVGSP